MWWYGITRVHNVAVQTISLQSISRRDKPMSSKQEVHAKRSGIVLSVTGPQRWPLQTDAPCHSRCGTLNNPHCSMTISAGHRSKFAVLKQNGDYSIWVKNRRVKNCRTPNKKKVFCFYLIVRNYYKAKYEKYEFIGNIHLH